MVGKCERFVHLSVVSSPRFAVAPLRLETSTSLLAVMLFWLPVMTFEVDGSIET